MGLGFLANFYLKNTQSPAFLNPRWQSFQFSHRPGSFSASVAEEAIVAAFLSLCLPRMQWSVCVYWSSCCVTPKPRCWVAATQARLSPSSLPDTFFCHWLLSELAAHTIIIIAVVGPGCKFISELEWDQQFATAKRGRRPYLALTLPSNQPGSAC